MYALDAATGHLRWSYATGGAAESGLVVAGGGIVYVVSGGQMYALDAAAGHLRWTYTNPGGGVISSPAVAGNAVYVGGEDHKVYALNAGT